MTRSARSTSTRNTPSRLRSPASATVAPAMALSNGIVISTVNSRSLPARVSPGVVRSLSRRGPNSTMSSTQPMVSGSPTPMIENTPSRPSPAESIRSLTNRLTDVPIIVIDPPRMTA